MLKRSGFSKPTLEKVIASRSKPRKALKRATMPKAVRKTVKLRKVSKQPISLIQRKLWEECKRIIRAKYPPVCYTCGKLVSGSNDHTAHFIPKSVCGANLKYDLRNLRRCCYYCNINLGGNGAMYYKKMVEVEGQDYVDKLFEDKKVIVKAYDHYFNLLDKYKSFQ